MMDNGTSLYVQVVCPLDYVINNSENNFSIDTVKDHDSNETEEEDKNDDEDDDDEDNDVEEANNIHSL
jgi:hypothetical protein